MDERPPFPIDGYQRLKTGQAETVKSKRAISVFLAETRDRRELQGQETGFVFLGETQKPGI